MSATVSVPSAQRWWTQLCSGNPHQIIGDPDQPYLLRWFLIPQNRWCNVYLHRFQRSDEPVPHDHPWSFVSLILRTGYVEIDGHGRRRRRRPGSLALRRASYRHYVTLDQIGDGERPATTVIITGRRSRQWGFWCSPTRFVPWWQFGPGGCGEPHP